MYLSYYLILDWVNVLLIGHNKLEIFQFGLPYMLTTFVLFHIVYIGGQYILSQIDQLFGVDFISNGENNKQFTPRIAPLFTEKGFQEFQRFVSYRLNRKWILIVSIIITLLILFLGLWGSLRWYMTF